VNRTEILEAVRDYVDEKPKKEFIAGKSIVPASGAIISPEDISSVVDAALEGWFTEHKKCAAFKRALSKVTGKEHITLCNSGSSATLLAITSALEIFPKKKYIVTCGTNFPTTVSPIYQNGQIPIYIDIDPETLSPDLDDLEYTVYKYWDEISGVVLAHTLGFPFYESGMCEMVNGFFVADCCDALGSKVILGKKELDAGHFSDFSTYSFFPAHHVTTGEGGAVLSDSDDYKTIVDSYANWGRDCYCEPGQSNTCGKRFEWEWEHLPKGYDHKYTFTRIGYNLKMTELQAALGLSQIARLDEFTKQRIDNFWYYHRAIYNMQIEEFISMITIPQWSKPSPFGFPIIVKDGAPFETTELVEWLETHKIKTRRVFAGNITRQPAFAGLPYAKTDLSGSDKIMRDCLWWGVQPEITYQMREYVMEVFRDFFVEKGLL